MIAGATDIIGFLGLNGLFTAHITGNLVVLAAHIVAGEPTIFSYILSVPVFMLVLFLTRLLAGAERAGATDRNDPAGRLRLLDANVEVYKDIVLRLHAVAPQALVLAVTDPPDPLADAVRMLWHDRVLSTGTYLDSLRFRFHLASRLVVRS